MNSIGKSVASIKEQRCDARPAPRARRIRLGNSGFSMVELIVVVGIIALLVGFLIPAIKHIRQASYTADTQAFINNLASACEQYFSDFKAYPGPLPLDALRLTNDRSGPQATYIAGHYNPGGSAYRIWNVSFDGRWITESENLTLGLLGGLRYDDGVTSPGAPPVGVKYDPSLIGSGPRNLKTVNGQVYHAYIDQANLDWAIDSAGKKHGHFVDSASRFAWTGSDTTHSPSNGQGRMDFGPPFVTEPNFGANDSIIPEFLDRFPAGMPILYLRAKVGVAPMALNYSYQNPICSQDASGLGNRPGTYDISQFLGYTDSAIGENRALKQHGLQIQTLNAPGNAVGPTTASWPAGTPAPTPDAQGRYSAWLYFRDPSSTDAAGNYSTPRKKDAFILISPGPDRVYGTKDDITNFGSP